ncbi:MAG TPA: NfeD family protein [Epsilonproteobacteria bacterium]|nr:NfeD family protein [Campylobacterota bacterium]
MVTMLWWHWIVIGIVLLIIELNIGTFFTLALAVAAILVGIIDFFIPMGLSSQLLWWMVFSLIGIALWYRYFKTATLTKSGQSNYKLDTLGTVTEGIAAHQRGKVKFDNPVLGDTVWHATSKVDIDSGMRVCIVQINGQLIEVAPIS